MNRRRRDIRFDNPDDPTKGSSVLVDLVMRLQLLDFVRRSYERKGDEMSLRRAEELREYFRKAVLDSVEAVRALVSEDLLIEHTRMEIQQVERFYNEQKEQRKKDRKLAKLKEEKGNEDKSQK